MIRLIHNGQTQALPDGYYWKDEFGWGKKAQVLKRLLPQDGVSALLIQETAKAGGQPVTLGSEQGPGFMPRSQLEALQAWADLMPSPTMTLEQDGRASMAVLFDFSNGPAIEASPIFAVEPPAADDWWWVTLHLIRG